jgi:hypothetical protein
MLAFALKPRFNNLNCGPDIKYTTVFSVKWSYNIPRL